MSAEPTSDIAPAAGSRPRVGLALGAGGAKGLAYIGVIEELDARGFDVVAIAGSSMGALIGGIYAAGKLDVYRDWVSALAKLDVLRLVDWSLSGGGLIKGERIIGVLRELIGEERIEELPITYTAVATDIDRQREVWLDRGPLFEAIRASIAIPSIFRPHMREGRRLVDGGLLNPVPVMPLLGADCEYIFAVSVDGPSEAPAPEQDAAADDGESEAIGYGHRIAEFVSRLVPHGEPKEKVPGALELLNQSLDLMQANLAGLRLAAYRPDLLIELPRNMATSYQFYRARELIARGREQAGRSLDAWECLPK